MVGSDKTVVSARDEGDRIKDLAQQNNLRVDQFKMEGLYITTVGFFSSKQEAVNFRNIIVEKIPFFRSTNPKVQNIREWCPDSVDVGTHLECRRQK